MLHGLAKTPFESSTGQKNAGLVKDKQTGKNGLELLIGWRDSMRNSIQNINMIRGSL
jgi:hypothetical protein